MATSSKNKNAKLTTAGLLVLFGILAILIILPIAVLFIASFKPGSDLLQYGLNLNLNPERMSLDTTASCSSVTMSTGAGFLTAFS